MSLWMLACCHCHMIFDDKMKDFGCKARHLVRGHMTKALAILTCTSVVSQETVHRALLVAGLNSIDISASDVLNSYITTPCNKKIWTTLGEEFGDDCGYNAMIV